MIPSKCLSALLLVLMVGLGCKAQPATGYWVGTMNGFGKSVDVAMHFAGGSSTFSSKDLQVLEAPLTDLNSRGGEIRFAWATDDRLSFTGEMNKGAIHGTVRPEGAPSSMRFTFDLTRTSDAPPPRPYEVESLSINSKGAKLSADIYRPRTPKPHPALVLLHGSGPHQKSLYAFDADFFASQGFEVLIFDKRGCGSSTGNYWAARYEDLANDAIACLETMKARSSVDARRIGLWGYSQGAMLLPWIAEKTPIPSFLIARSPEVFGITEGAIFSDTLRVMASGGTDREARIVSESHRTIETMIHDGRNREDIAAFINQNADRNPFMNRTGLQGNMSISREAFSGFYWQGRTQKFDASWRNVKIPTLALFGEDDDVLDAIKNRAALESTGNGHITTNLFPRAGHNLRRAFNPAKYPDMDFPRGLPEVFDATRQWIKAVTTAR